MSVGASVQRAALKAFAVAYRMGVAGDVVVTRGAQTYTARAIDTEEGAKTFSPASASVAPLGDTNVTRHRRNLFHAPKSTAGASLPFDAAPGDFATWEAVTWSVVSGRPLRTGGGLLFGYFLDLER